MAPQNDVESVAKAVLRDSRVPVEGSDEPIARGLMPDAVKDGVERQQLIARKIHLGDQSGGKRRSEYREVNVGGAPRIVVVAPRVGAGPDRFESKPASWVGDKGSAAGKVGVQRGVMLITRVKIAACCVRLPDLHQGSRNGPAIFVQNSSINQDPLADGFSMKAFRQIDGWHGFGRNERWSGEFREGLRQTNQGLAGRSLHRGGVRGMMVSRQNAILILSIEHANRRRIKWIHRERRERLYGYRTNVREWN